MPLLTEITTQKSYLVPSLPKHVKKYFWVTVNPYKWWPLRWRSSQIAVIFLFLLTGALTPWKIVLFLMIYFKPHKWWSHMVRPKISNLQEFTVNKNLLFCSTNFQVSVKRGIIDLVVECFIWWWIKHLLLFLVPGGYCRGFSKQPHHKLSMEFPLLLC